MADSLTDRAGAPLPPPLLEMRGIVKRFPGVVALDHVDFDVRAGEIHALMGENGAGKSTLIRVLTGALRRDTGAIRLRGETIEPRSPAAAQRLGISTVYQEINLVPQLSVAENLALGRQPTRWRAIRWREVRRRARDSLRRLDLDVDVSRPLGSCSIAVQQMVAIVRALDVDSKLLVLDEPTSSLDDKETQRLFEVMRKLRANGLGIIFITHFIDQVYEVADRVTVLRNGRRVGTFDAAGLPRIDLVAKMLGREIGPSTAADAPTAGPARSETPLVSLRGFGRRGAVEEIDLDIHRGEVVGLAGLLGSGRTELARLIFGLDRPDHGRLRIGGKDRRLASPRAAIARHFALLPEDRQAQGLVPDVSVRENIILALQAKRGWMRAIPKRRQEALAQRYIRSLQIATPDADRPIRQLSGGNQQKAILARWLATEPALLILDEPTRGIDVGAKAEVEKLIASLRRGGMAIVLISSELEEVVRDSSRIVILRDRRQAGTLEDEEMTERRVMEAIAGGASA